MLRFHNENLTPVQIENNRTWIKALRSGKFKQGSDVLLRYDAAGNEYYCCLGVACAIKFLPFNVSEIDSNLIGDRKASPWTYGFGSDDLLNILEEEFAKEVYGLRTDVGSAEGYITEQYHNERIHLTLVGLNDSKFTFSQIADCIEYSLDNLP